MDLDLNWIIVVADYQKLFVYEPETINTFFRLLGFKNKTSGLPEVQYFAVLYQRKLVSRIEIYLLLDCMYNMRQYCRRNTDHVPK